MRICREEVDGVTKAWVVWGRKEGRKERGWQRRDTRTNEVDRQRHGTVCEMINKRTGGGQR